MYKRAVKIVHARMGILSNNEKLINEPRYFEGQVMESLLTNIHSIEKIPFSDDLDSYFLVIDEPHVKPQVKVTDKVCTCTGNFTRYERECSDNRYSLFGNLGLFFKYLLATLERYHNIHSFHASSMYSPSRNTLLMVVGGAGAGKTVFLLKGLEEDWRIFSTEMTHFRFTERGYEFYMGSLFDNIRLGNLIYDFPRANEKLKVGGHTFQLLVEDDSGNVSNPAKVVLIVMDTQAPTAVLTLTDSAGQALANNRIAYGEEFVLNAKKSVDVGGGRIVSYTWSLED